MGCACDFTNLTTGKQSKESFRNVFRCWDDSETDKTKVIMIFKDIISREKWNDTNDVILGQCCCRTLYYNDDKLYDAIYDLGEYNDKIKYFINLSYIKREIERRKKLMEYREFCILCRKQVGKLYMNQSCLKICENC